jgi:hypothetical protein
VLVGVGDAGSGVGVRVRGVALGFGVRVVLGSGVLVAVRLGVGVGDNVGALFCGPPASTTSARTMKGTFLTRSSKIVGAIEQAPTRAGSREEAAIMPAVAIQPARKSATNRIM